MKTTAQPAAKTSWQSASSVAMCHVPPQRNMGEGSSALGSISVCRATFGEDISYKIYLSHRPVHPLRGQLKTVFCAVIEARQISDDLVQMFWQDWCYSPWYAHGVWIWWYHQKNVIWTQTIKSTFVVPFCRFFHFKMMNVAGSLLFSLGEGRHLFGLGTLWSTQWFLANAQKRSKQKHRFTGLGLDSAVEQMRLKGFYKIEVQESASQNVENLPLDIG